MYPDYLMGALDIRNPYQSNIIKTNNKEEDLVLKNLLMQMKLLCKQTPNIWF